MSPYALRLATGAVHWHAARGVVAHSRMLEVSLILAASMLVLMIINERGPSE